MCQNSQPSTIGISNTVVQYNTLCNELAPLVKQYFKENNESWKDFRGWNFSEDGTKIIISYSYEDFYSVTKNYDTEIVPLENIIKLIKTIEICDSK